MPLFVVIHNNTGNDAEETLDRDKKKGIIIMMIGVCIPLISLCFTRGYNPEQNIVMNIYNLSIPIGQKAVEDSLGSEKEGPKGKVSFESLKKMIPRSIAFRFILALGVLMIFLGFVKLDATRQKARENGSHNSRN